MQDKRTFLRIQILRFIAAAVVVAYHAQITTISYFGGSDPYPLLELGVYGVDLFFVISGFIIVFIGSSRETTASVFVKRRVERIVPMYWIMTAATFALTHIPGLARNEVSGPWHLLQSLLFVSWVNGPETYPVLNVGWTLEYEVLFYAVAAASMALTKRAWATAAFVMLALVLSGRGTSFFLQNPIMIEFVFGMTIGTFLYDRRLFPWMLLGCVLVLLTLPMSGAAWRVWAFGVPSAALVSLALYADFRRPYSGTVLPELGNASYSIYLVHVIAISFVCKVASVMAPNLSTAVGVPLISVFAIAVGYLSYRLIERNLLRLLGRKRRKAALVINPPVHAK
ncbi:acyltransferase [Sphingomonas sp. UV9]|uniref:acyltransferase family protein n=1 Tax=Sphingomonas sp. UV9 TaxID=1851410 RepID=UPI0013E8E3B5|nr:acyltransferase [Sphingomonas sp. UV9]